MQKCPEFEQCLIALGFIQNVVPPADHNDKRKLSSKTMYQVMCLLQAIKRNWRKKFVIHTCFSKATRDCILLFNFSLYTLYNKSGWL